MAAENVATSEASRPNEIQDLSTPAQSPARDTSTPDLEGESEEARLERLGRQRPDKFPSIWEEIGFAYSVAMSQALTEYFVSGFNVILPTTVKELNIPSASSTWPANAFSLVVACFLLTFGRLGDMYGGFPVYVGGILWFTVWSFIAGWSQNEIMLDVCRALQGLGPAAYLPTGLMLLGTIYRPGPRKNLVFAIYGAMAPLGFYTGIFFGGLTAQYTTWRWYFFIGTILSLSTVVVAYFCIPSDVEERKGLGIKMDWWGAVLISVGLVLVVFAITDSGHAPKGWATPYIFVLLIVGVLILVAAIYVEGWVAEQPLIPFEAFKVKYMKPLTLALLFSYGSLGIFLLYATFYMTNIMGGSPLQLVAWFTPMALGGCIISTVGGLFLHRIPGTLIILLAGAAWIISPLMFAIAPSGANYWAYTFPSMICATIAIDLTFTVTNVFFTSSMPMKYQGFAGALINSLVQLSIAIFLGFADVAAAQTADLGLKKSYKAVFWFEVGCAAFAQVIMFGLVKLKPATSELTVDEKAALEREEAEALQNVEGAAQEENEKLQEESEKPRKSAEVST